MLKMINAKAEKPQFSTWEELDRVRLLIYGGSGAGKTYRLRTLPGELIIFNDWGGPLSLPKEERIHVVDLEMKKTKDGKRVERSPTEKVEIFTGNISYLATHPEEQPECLVIDNFSQFYADTVRAVVEQSGMKDAGGHYGIAQECWQVLTQRLRLLRSHIILVCLEEDRNGKIGPAISPGMANAVLSWCDAVVRLVPIPTKEEQEKGTRALFTQALPDMTARIRGEREILPAVIRDPDLSEIIKRIMGAANGDDEDDS